MIQREFLSGNRHFLIFLSCLVALAPLAIDMYMPGMGRIATTFDASYSAVNLTMSAYLLGNAIGQFFGGSLSDQLGRRPIGIAGLTLFFFSSIGIVFSPNIQTMQILRLLQAVGGGFAMVICIAQVRDIYPADQVMRRYAKVIIIMLIAPMVAPIIGAALIQISWQSIFLLLSAYSLVLLVIYVYLIPETRSSINTQVNFTKLFAGYGLVITYRVNGRITPLRYALYSALSSGIFMCFLTNVSMVFMNHYKISEFTFAIGFALVGGAMMLGNRLSVKINDYIPALQWLKIATSIQFVSIAILITANILAVDTVWSTAILFFIIIGMNGSIMPMVSAQFINYFDELAGSASSLLTALAFGLGGLIGAVAAVWSRAGIVMVFITMLITALFALAILLSIQTNEVDSKS